MGMPVLRTYDFQTKKHPQGVFFYLEAWVGIEPASKDLQSSA